MDKEHRLFVSFRGRIEGRSPRMLELGDRFLVVVAGVLGN